MSKSHVALLRGINVGGNKKVDMAGLRALLSEFGYADVRTLLNSGNAVFIADTEPAAAPIERAILARFGFEVAVVLRTGAEIAGIIAHNPFADMAKDGSRYFVSFLARPLPSGALADLDAAAYQPELVHVTKSEIYCWLPAGLTDSPLMKQFTEKKLGVPATARNWNTVTKLAALTDL